MIDKKDGFAAWYGREMLRPAFRNFQERTEPPFYPG